MIPYHRLTAWEPVFQKKIWKIHDGEVVLESVKDKHQPDLPGMYHYSCCCGESFKEWEAALQHLEDACDES